MKLGGQLVHDLKELRTKFHPFPVASFFVMTVSSFFSRVDARGLVRPSVRPSVEGVPVRGEG